MVSLDFWFLQVYYLFDVRVALQDGSGFLDTNRPDFLLDGLSVGQVDRGDPGMDYRGVDAHFCVARAMVASMVAIWSLTIS